MSHHTTKKLLSAGGTVFASSAMLLIGCFQIILGIAALAGDDLFVTAPGHIFDIGLTAWGWIHLGIGVVVALAALNLFARSPWGRAVGIVMATVSAIANFFFIPYYPLWSIMIVALDVFVIWSLANVVPPPPPGADAPGHRPREGKRQPDWEQVNESAVHKRRSSRSA